MTSPVVKRSVVIEGHKTSVSLEDAFWKGLKEITSNCRLTLSEVVGKIDATRQHRNLSSAIRLFVLDHYRNKIGAALGTRSPDGQQMQLPSLGADAATETDLKCPRP